VKNQHEDDHIDSLFFIFCSVIAMMIEIIPSFGEFYEYLPSFLRPTNLLSDPIRYLLITTMTFIIIIYLTTSFIFKDMPENKMNYSFIIKMTCILISTIILVIIPTVKLILLRHFDGRHLHCHDGGVIQIEEAINFLLTGTNPYSADYSQTPMIDWNSWATNPALLHIPYLPLSFLFSIPLYLLSMFFLGWYDQRFLYLLLYYPTLFLATQLASKNSHKLRILTFVAINPLFILFFIQGYNDIMILFWILLGLYLLKIERRKSSLISLACACAIKQTAWIIIPFYLVVFWRRELGEYFKMIKTKHFMFGDLLIFLKSRLIEIFPFLLIFSMIVLPFVLWNPADFIDDIYLFNVGLSDNSNYFIRGYGGYGIGTIVLFLKLVSSSYDYFPFWIFQLVFGIPIVVVGLMKLRRESSIANLLNIYALIGFTFFFFSRFFHLNYFGYFLVLLSIGIFCDKNSIEDHSEFDS
jgi:hypothetical protein